MSWRARRLDGTVVGGEVEVSLRVLSTREVVRSGGFGSSPYIVGSPVYVDREDMFFGRADIIEPIKRQLGASTHANVVLLEGNRRTGKTSILEQLGKAGVLPGWIPVYCSFQGAEGHDSKVGIATREVFRLFAREIGRALHDAGVETWIPGQPARDPDRSFKAAFRVALDRAFADEHGFEMLQLYIAAAVEAASPRRVLLMLDEFDKLHEGIEAGITSPQVPENIRHLLQHQPGLCAIIAGSRRLKRLREQYWSALFGLGYRIGVSALPLDDARRLVTQPVEGRLGYLPQARDRLVELCACHPFLVQLLCNRVFEQAASRGAPTITVEAVEQAATEMVRDNEHFQTLWDYAGSARRRLILALCDRCSEGPDPVSLDLLEIKLRDNGVPVRRFSELSDDVAELRELELIEFDDSYRGGTYRLSVPLMARWLQGDRGLRRRRETSEAGGGHHGGRTVTANPYQVFGPSVPSMLGRGALINEIEGRLLKDTPDHVSLVGPMHYGKSVLLSHLADTHRTGSSHYLTTVYIDFRISPPASDATFKQRLAKCAQDGVAAGPLRAFRPHRSRV